MFKKMMTYIVLVVIVLLVLGLSFHYSFLDGTSNGLLYMGIIGSVFFFTSRYILPMTR